MFLIIALVTITTSSIFLGKAYWRTPGAGKSHNHTTNNISNNIVNGKHKRFRNEFLFSYSIVILLSYSFGLHYCSITFALLLFFKFFGRLHENVRWVLSTLCIGFFLNSGPLNLILGLELLSTILAALAVRFAKERCGLQDERKLLKAFLINLVSFLLLFYTLSTWSLDSSISDKDFWNITTRTLVSTYYLIKFGTILSAYMKVFLYEALPLQVLAMSTLVQVIFVPILTFAKLSTLVSPGALVGTMIFLVANVPLMSKVMESKSLVILIAYTTAITNGWLVLLLIL